MNRIPFTDVVSTHNVFLNTNASLSADARDAYFSIPQGCISTEGKNQQLRLSLASYSQTKYWYDINVYNQSIYLVLKGTNDEVKHTQITVPQGNYQSFLHPSNGFIPALQTAFTAALSSIAAGATVAVGHSPVTGQLALAFNMTGAPANFQAGVKVKLVCFTIPNFSNGTCSTLINTIVGNPNVAKTYSDSNQVFGGAAHTDCTINTFEGLTSVCPDNATTGAQFNMLSDYAMRLATLENIYVRCSAGGPKNWENSAMSTGASDDGYKIASSQILAMIHVPRPAVFDYTDYAYNTADPPVFGVTGYSEQVASAYRTIRWESPTTNMYSIELSLRNLANLRLTLTDELGRLLAAPSSRVQKGNLMGALVALKIQIMQ